MRSAGLGMLGASGLLGACGQEKDRVLRAADTQPDGYPTVEAVRHMATLLRERSEGRLRLKLYSGGQLGSEKDTLEITIFGGLDFNRVNLAPLNSISQLTLVPALPFIFRDIPHMRAAMDGPPGQRILQSLKSKGLIGLCYYDSGARSFYTTSRPINEPDDLKGMKIRVQNSDLYVSMVEALGGDATPMAYGEVYQGLLQGVVDGAENNFPSFESSRHFEAARYYSLTRHVMAPEVLLVSQHRWDKLSGEDQALIRQCASESVPVMRELWDARVNAARVRIEASGVEIHQPDTAAFVDQVQPVWEKYIRTPALKQLVEDIRQVGN